MDEMKQKKKSSPWTRRGIPLASLRKEKLNDQMVCECGDLLCDLPEHSGFKRLLQDLFKMAETERKKSA
ncbi:MAG: hypothetical protein JWO30_1392 [Fibrobacteres bacterium]|nr:hypothetical protein [Fibrobacterota bacterium]